MSYDEHNIKLTKSNNYLKILYKDEQNKNNNKNNLMTFNANSNKIKNEEQKIIHNRNQNQLITGPLFSTFESTITTPKNEYEESNSITQENQRINIKVRKSISLKDEDTIFLYDIFFKNNKYNTRFFFNIKKSDNIELDYSIKSHYNNTNNINNNKNYNFISIKKYLIKLQKEFNEQENSIIENKSYGNIKDNYLLQKLEDLITRYFLLIHIFIRCSQFKEAKKLFLLVIKANFNFINNIENKIYINYTNRNIKINYIKEIPKSTFQLLKLYTLIIRYSHLFNLNKYRNIFLGKYLKLQLLNYNFFMMKASYGGFLMEIKNQIKDIFSNCFHNAFYYCVQNYIPMRIPIIFNSSIISLYKQIDESFLTEKEKSLLIKSLYNQGVLYYINNNLDEALLSLRSAKEKILYFVEDSYIIKDKKFSRFFYKNRNNKSLDLIQKIKKDSVSSNNSNSNKNLNFKRIDNFKRRTDNKKVNKTKIDELFDNINNFYDLSSRKHSIISLENKNKKRETSIFTNTKYEYMYSKININLIKEKISINDIEMLLNFGKGNMLLNDDSFSIGKNFAFFGRKKEKFYSFKKSNKTIKSIRGSHIDFRTSMKIRKFNIPETIKNPLLRNIELLMCLIELHKKNYEGSYGHILKLFYLIILLKLGNNDNKYTKDFFNQQKYEIDKYFEMIEKSYEIYIKNEKISKMHFSDKILDVDEIVKNQEKNHYDDKNINIGSFHYKSKNKNNNVYHEYINNPIFESISKYNHYKNNNGFYNSNDNFNIKTLFEFKKFFIFLTGLSLYQMKILNETQPESDKRNNLPIIFSNQFKDCLIPAQRIELDNIDIMALNRFMILAHPNKWILPTNLNMSLLYDKKSLEFNKRNNCNLSPFERYNYIDDNCRQTKEYKNYLSILNSRKCSGDIKDFIIKNKNFVIKILKDVDEQEVYDIIEYPHLIIEPIKNYKRKMKSKIKVAKKVKVKNYLDNLFRRDNNSARMKTVTINSKSMQNELKRKIRKKMGKRNKSIVSGIPLFSNFINKKKKKNNKKNDSYEFDDFSLSNDL